MKNNEIAESMKRTHPQVRQLIKEEGIREACAAMHQHCLREGMECEPAQQRAYTEMILFLNSTFGHLRVQNT